MGRLGKPRAIGRKGAQRRVRPLHQVRRSPMVYFVHWHNALYITMGECDRKPRLVVGGKSYPSSNAVRSTNVTDPYSCWDSSKTCKIYNSQYFYTPQNSLYIIANLIFLHLIDRPCNFILHVFIIKPSY